MNDRFYQLKIHLTEIEPIIWRRFVVPAEISLDRLHDVIQIVMGWTDTHLYQFTIGSKNYTENPEFREDGIECSKYRLGDLIKQNGRTFRYLYDFGDSWEHELIIEDNRYVHTQQTMGIICLEGEHACPPEDVGGVPRYYEFIKAITDPKHEEHERLMQWSGGDFDSEQFDIYLANIDLLKYQRWSRDRLLSLRA